METVKEKSEDKFINQIFLFLEKPGFYYQNSLLQLINIANY